MSSNGRGFVLAAVGAVFVAGETVFAATAEVGNPFVLLAAWVAAGLVCLCLVAAGLAATRIDGAGSAVRLRRVFVVLEGAALVAFFPLYWTALNVVDPAGEFSGGITAALTAPVVIALVLVVRISHAVHKVVVGECGPIVAGTGEGAPADRVKALGVVLVVAGAGLSISAAVVVSTVSAPLAAFLAGVVVVTLSPLLLGVALTRVKDVHSARRRGLVVHLVVPAVVVTSAGNFAFKAEPATAVLLSALMVGAIALLVTAGLVLREFVGAYDRPWQVSR